MSSERVHVRARLIVGGLLSWFGAAWLFPAPPQTLGVVTLALALWHLLLAAVLERRAPAPEAAERSGSTPFAALGWVQTMVGGAVLLDGPTLGWWWVAMAVVALALPLRRLARLRSAAILLPSVAAVSWVLSHAGEPWALGLGLIAAALPLAAALLDRDELPATDAGEGAPPLPGLALSVVSLLLWGAVVLSVGPAQHAPRLCLGLVPIAAILGRICWRPSQAGVHLGALLLGLSLSLGLAAVVDGGALRANPLEAPLALALPLLGVAAMAAALIARARSFAARASDPSGPDIAPLGLVCASAGGLVLALGFAASFGATAVATAGLGESLSAAFAGLALLVAGLRLEQESWRHIGLAAIAGACFKVVFFDLAAAALVWRALSFVGLGAVLITGAFAYTRALRRKQPSAVGI